MAATWWKDIRFSLFPKEAVCPHWPDWRLVMNADCLLYDHLLLWPHFIIGFSLWLSSMTYRFPHIYLHNHSPIRVAATMNNAICDHECVCVCVFVSQLPVDLHHNRRGCSSALLWWGAVIIKGQNQTTNPSPPELDEEEPVPTTNQTKTNQSQLNWSHFLSF